MKHPHGQVGTELFCKTLGLWDDCVCLRLCLEQIRSAMRDVSKSILKLCFTTDLENYNF